MDETLGGGTDISGTPAEDDPADTTTPTRVRVNRQGVPRRVLAVTMALSTVVLTVVGVLAVLLVEPPATTTGPPSQAGTAPSVSLPEPTPRECWTGDRVASDEPCPELTGRAGLTWLVTTSEPFEKCVPFTEERAPGELEVYDCLWAGQGADVFISRWDSVRSARVYFDQGPNQRAGSIPGGRGAMTWSDDAAAYPYRATVYLDAPYSVNVVGLTVEDRDAALARIQVRPPAEVAQQGADR